MYVTNLYIKKQLTTAQILDSLQPHDHFQVQNLTTWARQHLLLKATASCVQTKCMNEGTSTVVCDSVAFVWGTYL